MAPFPSSPYELGPDEQVTRFIYSTSQFSSDRGRPKQNAFSPFPNHELSVVHSTKLTDQEIWKIGESTLGDRPGRDKIHARADVFVSALNESALQAIRDDDPFERHTSVVGWPQFQDENERKQRWKLICIQLNEHEKVFLVLPPKPITKSADPTSA